MVYQALLFSGDEKASRTVSQILNELEFDVEVCAEPFAAVKQITSQHYDALVVDCDNEQNATLLFKSARNSGFNSACLAVALVQGQAGIAKAFRIGANLVLTKPIHVEQSKGTLRTAKGLLRKAEAARSTSAAASAPKLADASVTPLSAPPPLAAHAGFSVGPVASGTLELQEDQFPELEPAEAALLESMPEPMPMQSSPAASGFQANSWQPTAKSSAEPMTIQTLAGSATGAAPAKTDIPPAADSIPDESTPEGLKRPSVAEKKNAGESPLSRREAFAESTRAEDDVPMFGQTLGRAAIESPETGNRKNFWIAAVLVLASAGAINYGWPQFQPLLMSLPLVQKYFAPQQMPHPGVVPASIPAAAKSATSPRQPSATTTGSEAQPGAANIVGQTPAPRTYTSTTSAVASTSDSASLAGSTSPAQRALHLAPEVAAGLLLEKVDPVYPPLALQQHVEGSVELQANIGKDGSTSNLKVLSGKPLLAKAAAPAVRQWKYQPYELNGQPTEVQTEITIDFKLPQP